jgi:hypothetical protein
VSIAAEKSAVAFAVAGSLSLLPLQVFAVILSAAKDPEELTLTQTDRTFQATPFKPLS